MDRMRIAIRVYIDGILQSEERLDVDPSAQGNVIATKAKQHADMMAEKSGYVEIEFLDELNPLTRYFRLGTDPRYMVSPVRLYARE